MTPSRASAVPQRDAFELARVLLADADARRAAELDADPRTWRPDPDELDDGEEWGTLQSYRLEFRMILPK